MAKQIQLRRDTGSHWLESNPVLASGEIGINIDDNRFKIGDGVTTWSGLEYSKDGEVNTASNIGIGEGIFHQKDGVDFKFKSLKAVAPIELSSEDDLINIGLDVSETYDYRMFSNVIYLTYSGTSGTLTGEKGCTLVSDGNWEITDTNAVYHLDTEGGNLTITLPDANELNEANTITFRLPFSAPDSNAITLKTTSSQNIGPKSEYIMCRPGDYVELVSNNFGSGGALESWRWRVTYSSKSYKNLYTVAKYGGDFDDIQSAIDYVNNTEEAGIHGIRIMPGYYDIESTIVIDGNKCSGLYGLNSNTIVLKPTSALLGKPVLDIVSNATIYNITIDATEDPAFRTVAGSVGINVDDAFYTEDVLQNTIIKGFYTNLNIVGNTGVTIYHSTLTNAASNITVGSGSALFIESTSLYDADLKYVYAYGDAKVYLGNSILSSSSDITASGVGIVATEDSSVDIYAGTNLRGLYKNIIVEDDAAVKVDNCVLDYTKVIPGISQQDDSSLIIINSRAWLGYEDVYIETPENVYINSYDSSAKEIVIGTGANVDANLFSINTGQLTKPEVVYKSDCNGCSALFFKNTTDGQKALLGVAGTNEQVNVAAKVIGTNSFAHAASLKLTSEQGDVVDGWQITKEPGTSSAMTIKHIDDTKAIQFNSDGSMQLNSGVVVNKVLDEDTLGSNDPYALATQQSIKTFIENTTYSKAEINAGQLDNMYYTESEINTLSGVLNTQFVHIDGSTELTNDWNVGNYEISANGFVKGNANVDLSIFASYTGVLTGGEISINQVDNTLLDVASGTCLYVDMSNREDPIIETLSWNSQTVDPDLTGFRTKWVGIYRTAPGEGSVIVDNEFTQAEKRSIAVLGRFWGQGDAYITEAKNYSTPAFGIGKTVEDIIYATGSINIKGNTFSAATVSGTPVMQLYRTAGESFRFAANYGSSPSSPNISVSGDELYSLYQYHIQSSYTNIPKSSIDPNYYDNDGVLTEVPSGKWTVQYVYYFPVSHVLHLTYGQHLYDSPTLAMDGIFKDSYNIIPDVSYGAVLRCYIIVKEGATCLDDNTQGMVIEAIGNTSMIPGINNHGMLGGLQDDDHSQYLNEVRGDARYYTQLEVDTISGTITNNTIRRDGTQELIGDWDVGNYDITAAGFVHGRTRVEYAGYANITGILTGGEITVNSSDNTLIDVAAGKALYVNMSNRDDPLTEIITWEAQTYDPELTSINIKWIGVQRSGEGIGQIVSSSSFSQADKRTITILGRCWNFSSTAVVEGVGNYKVGAFSFGKTTQDLAYALGAFNIAGNVFYPTASGSMTLSRSEGEAFSLGANFINDDTSPNICLSATVSGINSYSYHLQNSDMLTLFEIDAAHYDLNGTRTVVTSGRWTVQRVYYYPGSDVVLVVYGQFMYDTYAEALEAIKTEQITLNTDILDGAILRAFIILSEGCVDLTDSDTAVILEATSVSVGGSSSSIANGVTNHANLTGLGNDDHYQYVLVDGARDFSSTVSYGTHPTFLADTNIVDKKYVDDSVAGIVTDHGALTGLSDDDHIQYSKVDGTRQYTDIVSYNDDKTFTSDTQIVDKKYVDDSVITQHGSLLGLVNDDHIQYLKADGTRNLIGKQSYSSHPSFINDTELVDKKYVDDSVASIVTDHGELSGLADDDHTQYLNTTRGDARYYTKTQSDTILANHHASTSSDHDDRYYTEAEVDSFVADLSDDIQTAINSLASGELPSCQLRNSNNISLVNTWSDIVFNNTDIENATDVLEHDNVDTYKLNIKQSGLYLISYNTQIGTTTTNTCYTRVLKNNTTVLNGSDNSIIVYNNERHIIGHSFLADLQQNDYIVLQMQFGAINHAIAVAPTTLIITALRGMKGIDGAPGADGTPGSGSTLIIKDNSTNVVNTPHSAINFKGGSVTITDGGNGVVDVDISTPVASVFGANYSWDSDDSTTGTTSATFQRKTTLSTTDMGAGYYRLGWYFEWRIDSTGTDIETRIIVDNTTVVMEHNQEAKDSSSWHTESGYFVTQLSAGNHSFGLDYRVENYGTTCYIRRARIEIWRVA